MAIRTQFGPYSNSIRLWCGWAVTHDWCSHPSEGNDTSFAAAMYMELKAFQLERFSPIDVRDDLSFAYVYFALKPKTKCQNLLFVRRHVKPVGHGEPLYHSARASLVIQQHRGGLRHKQDILHPRHHPGTRLHPVGQIKRVRSHGCDVIRPENRQERLSASRLRRRT